MKDIAWNDLIDKKDWEKGVWNEEPDKEQWKDKETGLPCLIVRNSMGALCGYVGINSKHQYFEKDYMDAEVNVHGGLTFADKCAPDNMHEPKICHIVETGEDDNIWWLGFDCGHYNDFMPGCSRIFKDGIYKDIAYVKNECKDLAKQLMKLANIQEYQKHEKDKTT